MTPKVPKSSHKFICKDCDYHTIRKSQYERHLLTTKHIQMTSNDDIVQQRSYGYVCECGKKYKYRQGLFAHRKTCNSDSSETYDTTTSTTTNHDKFEMLSNTILELVKENREFKQLIIDQNKQMMEMSKNMGGSHHTTNNNTNCNNKFNLNVFLNEKCKDAMSLKDFVNSMNISLEDYVQTGELGFVEGISKTIVKCINDMELYDRPLHCTDLKRETIYIKGGEKWEKDEDKVEFRKAVKRIANKNHKMTSVWMENTPDVNTVGTDNYEKFFTYMQSSLGGCGQDETKLFEDKIMRNVMREVTIDKKAVMD